MSSAGHERGLSLRSPGRFMAAAASLTELWLQQGDPDDTALAQRVADAWIGARAYQLAGYQMASQPGSVQAGLGRAGSTQAGPGLTGAGRLMDFTLSGEQRQFAASLHDMLAAADGPAAARAWAAGNREPGLKIWRALADAGVTALAVPAASGGLAAGPVDLVIACEEIGHHAIPGPAAETLAAIPALLAALGQPSVALAALATGLSSIRVAPEADQDRFVEPGSMKSSLARPEIDRWLRQLAAGELIATLAVPPVLPFAADAQAAGLVLLAERDTAGQGGGPGGGRLWAGKPGPARRSVDPARSLAEVQPARLLAEGSDVGRAVATALEYGTLACAAQLLGAGQALLEASATHARQRVQFGQPVGSFQAVKHQLADVLIKLEFARPLLFAAAVALGHGQASVRRDVSAAKVACADAAQFAARVALQVHGALGYTAEHDAGLWLTTVNALRSAWGSQAQHRARVLAALTGSPAAGSAGGTE